MRLGTFLLNTIQMYGCWLATLKEALPKLSFEITHLAWPLIILGHYSWEEFHLLRIIEIGSVI